MTKSMRLASALMYSMNIALPNVPCRSRTYKVFERYNLPLTFPRTMICDKLVDDAVCYSASRLLVTAESLITWEELNPGYL